MKKILFAVLLVLATGAFPAQAVLYVLPQNSLVQNGGFEEGFSGWGWTYNFGVGYGFPDAAEGRNFADAYGTLHQDLHTTAGQQYRLRFALAGNFNIASLTDLQVFWADQLVAGVSWSPAGHDINNLGWVWSDLQLTASSPTTRLLFSNPYVGDGSGRILRLDAVSVVAVPEPSALLLSALAALVLFVQRRAQGRE